MAWPPPGFASSNSRRISSGKGVASIRALALPDIHAPWGLQKALQWAVARAREFNPTHIVQVGDAYDLYSYSKFAKALTVTPEEELRDGRAQLEQLWAALRKVAPKAKCFQLYGNHDDRPLKRALDAAPELAPLVGRSLRELFSFPGVTTVHDSKEELFIGDVCFQHGHYSRIGDHARFNQCNTVHGHTHRGGTWFGRNRSGTFWELDCGVLGDPDAHVFGYRAQRKVHTCTVGLGLVTDRGPVFEGFPG